MKRKHFFYRETFLGLLVVAVLTGCSYFGPKVGLDSLTLDVAVRANNDSPIAVDFIAVKDLDLLKQLSGITAKQWFADREQYQRDYRQQIAVWGVELIPGQFIQSSIFPLEGEAAVGLLVFAGYNTPGAHRLRLDDQHKAWLKFDSREMSLLSDNVR